MFSRQASGGGVSALGFLLSLNKMNKNNTTPSDGVFGSPWCQGSYGAQGRVGKRLMQLLTFHAKEGRDGGGV